MSDAWSAVAGSLQRLGGAVGDYGETIIRMDAAAKRDAAQVSIIKRIEDFNRSLLTDPDYGTPEAVTGERAGYMKKFDDLMTEAERSAQEIDNHVARDEVLSFLERTKASQESAVAQLQFQKWGQASLSAKLQAIREYNDASSDPADAKIAHTYKSLSELLQYNVIGKDQATEILAGETQQIMRNVLLENAKTAYKEGGLVAAAAVIDADKTTVATPAGNFGASDAIKNMARQDLQNYHTLVQEQENLRMMEAYSNSIAFYMGKGDKQKPVLTIDMIMNSALDAENREHWIEKLRTLDNYMNTGAGSKDSGNIDALFGSMYQWAYSIKQSRGTATAGASFILTLPDGTQRTVTNDPRDFEAVLKDMMPAIAMAGKQDSFIKLMDLYADRDGKDLGTFAVLDQAIKDTATKEKWPAAILVQVLSAADAWKRQNPTATSEQVAKYIETVVQGKKVSINTAIAWDYNLGKQGNEEKIGRMIADGTAGMYMADLGNGVFDAESPLFKETYDQYKAAVEREIRSLPGGEKNIQIGVNAIARSTANGEFWISTSDPETLKSLGLYPGGRAPASAYPLAVSYTTRPFSPDGTMQRFRQVELPQKEFRNEVYLQGLGWVGVQMFAASDGTKYWDVPPAQRTEVYGRIKAEQERVQAAIRAQQAGAAAGRGAAGRYIQMAQPKQ